ncbi:unnamed protein product [Schistosoma turkestanicum]|nr:unnamed protein product [Schistosoma turkestanicum]
MILNTLWLNCRMLYLFSIHENLWQAHYLDEYDQMHPMDWFTLIQHLFMTFPRVLGMTSLLIVTVILLIHYLTFHIWLILINSTSYEYFQRKKLIRYRGDRDDHDDGDVKSRKSINKNRRICHDTPSSPSPSSTLFDADEMLLSTNTKSMTPSTIRRQQQSKWNHQLKHHNSSIRTNPAHNCNFYNKGIKNNLLEIYYSMSTSNSLRELKHRLPVQMAFKTR